MHAIYINITTRSRIETAQTMTYTNGREHDCLDDGRVDDLHVNDYVVLELLKGLVLGRLCGVRWVPALGLREGVSVSAYGNIKVNI